MRRRTVTVNDKMQKGYRYALSAATGRNFDSEFKPQLSPTEMLRLGVFGGKYMTDCRREFPKSWFARAKLSPERRDPLLNFFGVDASQPRSVWRKKGWLHSDDPRGWFQKRAAEIVLSAGPFERHSLAGVFLERLAIGGNRLLKALGSALTCPKRFKRGAEILLGHGPIERHALEGVFLECLAIGGNRLLKPLGSALTPANRQKRVAEIVL